MAAIQKAPAPYTMGMQPSDPALVMVFLTAELRKIQSSIETLALMTPQAATALPKVLADGMIRLSRSPWRPVVGQVADKWVYYDAPTATWFYMP